MKPIEFGGNLLISVSARVLNAIGDGYYTKGIRSDCKVMDDPLHLLGDPQEGILKTAITLLETG